MCFHSKVLQSWFHLCKFWIWYAFKGLLQGFEGKFFIKYVAKDFKTLGVILLPYIKTKQSCENSRMGLKWTFHSSSQRYKITRTKEKKWLVHLEPIWFMDKPRALMDPQDSSQFKFGRNWYLPPNNIFCSYPRGLYQSGLNLRAFKIHS